MAGYAVEIYHAQDKSDGSIGELYIARGIGSAAMFGDDGCASGRVLAVAGMDARNVQRRRLSDQGRGSRRSGERRDTMGIEKKPLDEKQFFPAADYWKNDMP